MVVVDVFGVGGVVGGFVELRGCVVWVVFVGVWLGSYLEDYVWKGFVWFNGLEFLIIFNEGLSFCFVLGFVN